MAKYALFAIVCLCYIIQVYSHEEYRARIPNGMNVPNPCDPTPTVIWPAVGHDSSTGGGPRNPFGEEFEAAHEKWTEDLCKADSDGDGKTNGQELGDPNCVWTEGLIPNITIGLSHPGICEPINSAKCCSKQLWLSCNSGCNASPAAATSTNAAASFSYHCAAVLISLIALLNLW